LTWFHTGLNHKGLLLRSARIYKPVWKRIASVSSWQPHLLKQTCAIIKIFRVLAKVLQNVFYSISLSCQKWAINSFWKLKIKNCKKRYFLCNII
jgi:hypothetical protein